jgi:hypothetical protein
MRATHPMPRQLLLLLLGPTSPMLSSHVALFSFRSANSDRDSLSERHVIPVSDGRAFKMRWYSGRGERGSVERKTN